MNHDDKLRMCEAMKIFGGGFAKALAECFIRADTSNLERLCNAFPEIIEQYMAMAGMRGKVDWSKVSETIQPDELKLYNQGE